MALVTTDLMISLDGCIAGPGANRTDNPGGDGGGQLHDWIAGLASWRERQGMEGGSTGPDDDRIAAWFDATGAVVMGRAMFDTGEAFWGDDPPFRCPVFILTHEDRPQEKKQGGTSYTFVTDGPASALAQARVAAGDRNVDIAGGADVVQQYLRLGAIDEIQLHVLPLLLGDGLRPFDDLGDARPTLEQLESAAGDGVTHLRYRVTR